MFTDLRNMKSILILVLVSVFIKSGICDKCTSKNLRVEWSEYSSDTTNGNIFDEGLNQAEFVRVIEDQNVTTLCQDTIKGITNVTHLILKSIGVEEIEPYTFQHTKNVFELELTKNNIREIHSNTFNGLKHLRILYLQYNQITGIDSEVFNSLENLAILKLDHNKIKTINSNWFKNLKNLGLLNLDGNEIEKLDEYTFKYKLRNDLLLDLSGNKINFIHPFAFDGLENIDSLYLDKNKIKIIPEDAFSTVRHINRINLMENDINCVTTETKLLQKADDIVLYINPWNCTCLEDLNTWYSKNKNSTIMATC